jgi:hypothetical protein
MSQPTACERMPSGPSANRIVLEMFWLSFNRPWDWE